MSHLDDPLTPKPQSTLTSRFSVTQVQFYTEDTYCIHGRCYVPIQAAKAKILIACATGVPQAFYRRFAEFICQQGFYVLSFDYRGVAESAPKQLKHMQMSYLDWGHYDLTAAIKHLNDIHPQQALPIFMIGHSFGGQALGLSPAHGDIAALFCFGTGAGWAGYMPIKERLKVELMWKILFPPIVALTGYLPWSKFNMGADLPKNVYQEWRRWCQSPDYFFADPEIGPQLRHQFAQVKLPIFAFSASDDDWALPNSRLAFIQHYSSAEVQYIDLNARDFNMAKIGHMGYFRQDALQIWQMLLQRMDGLIQKPTQV